MSSPPNGWKPAAGAIAQLQADLRDASTYSLVRASASCCRENGAKLNSTANVTRSECASLCRNQARCSYFSHGGPARRCELCVACTLKTGGFASKYSTFQMLARPSLPRCSCMSPSEISSLPCGVHCPLDHFGWACTVGCSPLARCDDPLCTTRELPNAAEPKSSSSSTLGGGGGGGGGGSSSSTLGAPILRLNWLRDAPTFTPLAAPAGAHFTPPLTIGIVGGSISFCHGVHTEACYTSLLARVPGTTVLNRAFPGVGAAMPSFCLDAILPEAVDVLLVDTAANDGALGRSTSGSVLEPLASMERLMRTVLRERPHTALLLLYICAPKIRITVGARRRAMSDGSGRCEGLYSELTKHYASRGLLVREVSLRRAVPLETLRTIEWSGCDACTRAFEHLSTSAFTPLSTPLPLPLPLPLTQKFVDCARFSPQRRSPQAASRPPSARSRRANRLWRSARGGEQQVRAKFGCQPSGCLAASSDAGTSATARDHSQR